MIEVQDTGIGIEEAQLGSLFEPFKQAEASTTRRFGGTGLGLTISHKLAQMMNGDMRVESELGRGSTFHFTLELTADPDQQTPRSITVGGHQRVLFLTRRSMIGSALRESMAAYDLEMDLVRSEEEATDRLSDTEYFAVFINECVGGFDGVAGTAIARMLKSSAPTTPFVVLRHIHQQLGDESTECLLKPLRVQALRDFILRHANLDANLDAENARILPLGGLKATGN